MVFVPSVSAQEQPKFPPTEAFYIEAVVDNPAPYVGQPFVYTFRFYAATVPAQTVFNAPPLAGFWRADQITTQYAELVGGRQYIVTATEIVLYALSDGQQVILPSELIIPESLFSDRPRLELLTESVVLQVQALPSESLPDYGGAVGRMDASLMIEPTSVTIGAPVSLQIRLTGTGNLEQVQAPTLPLPEGWRAYRNPVTTTVRSQGGTLVGERVFEWRLIPGRTGTATFENITFSYFDPLTGTYETTELPPQEVDVLPGADGLNELPGLSTDVSGTDAVFTLKPVSQELPQGELPVWFAILWLVPPAAVIAALGWRRGRVSLASHRARRRQERALAGAKHRLAEAIRLTGGGTFDAVEASIVAYLADKIGKPVTPLAAFNLLRDPQHAAISQIPQQDRQALAEVLQAAQEGRYMPSGDDMDARLLVRTALNALTRFDQQWGV